MSNSELEAKLRDTNKALRRAEKQVGIYAKTLDALVDLSANYGNGPYYAAVAARDAAVVKANEA